MLDILLDKIKKFFSSRLVPMAVLFIGMFAVLVGQLFNLQILQASTGEEIETENDYKNIRTRYISSTRGNILDRNGNVLAYNELSYSVVMANTTLMGTNSERNAMILKLSEILEENGYEIELDFPIVQNERTGELEFTLEGNSLLRFKKNAYGRSRISDLTDEERDSTAQEVFEFLRYGKRNVSSMFGISDDYSMEETLKIMTVRYALFTQYPQYSQFTIATNIDDKTIAAIKENTAVLPGVEVRQETSRVYNDSQYFAHIVGYTGAVNDDEIEELNEGLETAMYYTSDVIGKTGIEKELDSMLRGEKGAEEVIVNSLEREVSSETTKMPVAGDDVYLTIDRELQIACYHILENNIAAILRSKIVNSTSYGTKGKSASGITIPIYEVYNAFIENDVLDISEFRDTDATDLEKKTYTTFLEKRTSVTASLEALLDFGVNRYGNSLTDEMKDYLDYIYSMLGSDGVVIRSAIADDDELYDAYAANECGLGHFLEHCISSNYIDLALLGIGQGEYYSTEEIYDMLIDYIFERLTDNDGFERLIYKQLIFNYRISGRDLCLLLYEQGVLEYNENDYNRLRNGRISAYDFVIDKLTTLEITPGMLALEPCSGSIVITDVNTGDVLAMVTYPSYDNNMLANKIDWEYYQSLMNNNSLPLINRTTQQMTTTGSTFKPLMALAGLGEGLITTNTYIRDRGVFEEVVPSPRCWRYPGTHGNLNVTGAIMHSCNYFFYDIGYRMSLDSTGNYSDSLGVATIQKYAAMFGLAEKSGVEVPEAMPSISSNDAVRTAIGYYHNFAPIQIARYVTAIANRGKVYDLTLVDKIEDKDKNLIVDNEASVYNEIDIYSTEQWNAVQRGMYNVVNTSVSGLNTIYGDLGVTVAGKTGTAQVSLTHPSHGLFVSFAPYESPEIAVTVVLPNGYASANAAKLAREVYGLYFNDENKEELLSGDLTVTDVTSVYVAD